MGRFYDWNKYISNLVNDRPSAMLGNLTSAALGTILRLRSEP